MVYIDIDIYDDFRLMMPVRFYESLLLISMTARHGAFAMRSLLPMPTTGLSATHASHFHDDIAKTSLLDQLQQPPHTPFTCYQFVTTRRYYFMADNNSTHAGRILAA